MFIAFFVTHYVLRNFITLFCTPHRKKYCILHSKCLICMNPEPTEIDAINVSLQKLFTTCDVIKSGRIKYDEFAGFCRDHNVPKTEIMCLFDKLDMHKDGYNYFTKSSPQLNELIDTLNLAEFRQNQPNQSYLNESEDMKCGELIVSSMEAVPICQLTESAEDMQQQQLSLRAERAKEYQEELWNNPSGMEMYLLETQIRKVTQENKLLQSSLMKAKMSIYFLQVELEKLKKEAVEQRLQHEREILQKLKPIPQCKGTHYSLSEKLLDRVGEVNGSSSEYDSDDSDDSQDLLDRVWYSRFSVSADADTPCLNSGWTVSEAAGRHGSITPSTRRLLPAFPFQQEGADGLDSEAPVPVYRLVLAGDAGSGKSSVLLRLGMNEFRGDIQTTLGVDLHMKMMLVDGEKTGLQIWDTAGHERFRSITRSYFCKADGVLLLYDITSESSFRNITEWMAQIRESTDKLISMCVIGNKADLRPEHPEGSCVSAAHGERLAMAYRALFCETSAKEGTNIAEAVLHLARELKKAKS